MDGTLHVILGVAGLLALVSLLPPLAERLRLPFTVLLAVVGVLLGALVGANAPRESLGPVGDLMASFAALELDAEDFIYIFLPILLFESAVAIDVRRLLDDIAPILLLAVVAVVVTTAFVGALLTWVGAAGSVVCLLLGAIVATTDPAAVVGIFRDLGAPRRLLMLVEGESLLNDAAAIAMFAVLVAMLAGRRDIGLGEGMLAFVTLFVGGLAVGWLFGWALCLVVTQLRNLPMSEITLTVTAAYLAFVTAEHYLHVSGVVAVVTAALVVGSVGRTRISPESWEGMRHVWHQLGFWASSLIFLLAGMLLPPILKTVEIGVADARALLALLLATLVARGLVLFALLPLLTALRLAERVSHAYKAVILWGGLRGAVSLVLALAIYENSLLPLEARQFIAVQVTGFVLVTLFINGTTLRPLMKLLGLDRLAPTEQALRQQAMMLSLANIRESVETLARDYQIEPEVASRAARLYAERLAAFETGLGAAPALSEPEKVHVGLLILINREEELYLNHYKEGIVSRTIVEVLRERIGWLLEGVKAAGQAGYQREVKRALGFSRHMIWAMRFQQRLGLRGPLAHRLSVRFEALLINRMVLRELMVFNQRRLSPLLGADTAKKLATLLSQRLTMVEHAVAALKLRYPDYAPVVQHQYLGRAALRREAAEYAQMFDESLITREIHDDLKRDLDRRWRALEHPPRFDLELRVEDLVARVPLFEGLEPDRIGRIARLLKPRLALPDEVLVRRGDRAGSMFFLAAGSVEVALGKAEPIQLHAGDFFGEISLLTRQPRSATVRALGYCHLLELMEAEFRRLMDDDCALRTHIHEVATNRMALARGMLEQNAAETPA